MGFQVAVQAHRGSPDPSLGIAENTLPAFARSRQLGADGIELDVRLTADGALVVHHDASIPGIGNVADQDVRHLPDQVPLLAEVLGAMPDLTLNIEVKNLPTESSYDPDEAAARAVAHTLADTERGASTVVSSFWLPSLDAVLAVDPSLSTGLLVAEWADPSASLAMARDMGCRALHLHRSLVTAALVADVHAAGLAVAVWTVNRPDDVVAMVACGVDTIITDDVPLALARIPDLDSSAPEPIGRGRITEEQAF
ncbi:MAG TPA: glycerophosphodiester phosphodiesterase [Acidimicrobiales bacterium]|jgi:glycerophosphoryl diester phosphodiesterase|nr:glycerophosphodiester phosphodiesterase [Acidimicrobiales bacterium]